MNGRTQKLQTGRPAGLNAHGDPTRIHSNLSSKRRNRARGVQQTATQTAPTLQQNQSFGGVEDVEELSSPEGASESGHSTTSSLSGDDGTDEGYMGDISHLENAEESTEPAAAVSSPVNEMTRIQSTSPSAPESGDTAVGEVADLPSLEDVGDTAVPEATTPSPSYAVARGYPMPSWLVCGEHREGVLESLEALGEFPICQFLKNAYNDNTMELKFEGTPPAYVNLIFEAAEFERGRGANLPWELQRESHSQQSVAPPSSRPRPITRYTLVTLLVVFGVLGIGIVKTCHVTADGIHGIWTSPRLRDSIQDAVRSWRQVIWPGLCFDVNKALNKVTRALAPAIAGKKRKVDDLEANNIEQTSSKRQVVEGNGIPIALPSYRARSPSPEVDNKYNYVNHVNHVEKETRHGWTSACLYTGGCIPQNRLLQPLQPQPVPLQSITWSLPPPTTSYDAIVALLVAASCAEGFRLEAERVTGRTDLHISIRTSAHDNITQWNRIMYAHLLAAERIEKSLGANNPHLLEKWLEQEMMEGVSRLRYRERAVEMVDYIPTDEDLEEARRQAEAMQQQVAERDRLANEEHRRALRDDQTLRMQARSARLAEQKARIMAEQQARAAAAAQAVKDKEKQDVDVILDHLSRAQTSYDNLGNARSAMNVIRASRNKGKNQYDAAQLQVELDNVNRHEGLMYEALQQAWACEMRMGKGRPKRVENFIVKKWPKDEWAGVWRHVRA